MIKTNVPVFGSIFFSGDSRDDLRSIPVRKIRNGYSAIINQSDGGLFVWDPTSLDPDDNVKTIAPAGGETGRWLRIAGGDTLETLREDNGAALVGYRRSPAALTVNLFDRLAREVWAEDYGLSTTGTGTQNAAAFARAIADLPATGGIIRVGPGTFIVNQISLPVDPKVVSIQGSGVRATILEMGTAAGPLIQRNGAIFTDGRITGARIGGFTIRAHGESDKTNLTHRAVSFTGFCRAIFHDIAYKGNTNGLGSVGAVFEGNARYGSTYNNLFSGIEVASNNGGTNGIGPSRILYTNNAGLGSLGNPNLTEFRDSWIYDNIGLSLACDVHNSTRTRIDNVIFESCAGATAIGLGQSTIVTACWFELFAASIVTSAAASVDGSGSIVMGNYFSGAGTNHFDTIGRRVLWIANEGGGQTYTGVGYTAVRGATATPAAPTVTWLRGVDLGASLTSISSAVAIDLDALGRVTFSLRYLLTPASSNFAEFRVNAPVGFIVEQMTFGATRGANGKPVLSALQPDNAQFILFFDGADSHEMDIRVTLRQT